MNRSTYLKTLNEEIQKLNGIIDYKILHDYDYRREAHRHKKLLNQLRKEQASRAVSRIFHLFAPTYR